MADINWQDEPQKEAGGSLGLPPAQQHKKFSLPSSSSHLWIASTMVLIGIIVGFSIGKFTGG